MKAVQHAKQRAKGGIPPSPENNEEGGKSSNEGERGKSPSMKKLWVAEGGSVTAAAVPAGGSKWAKIRGVHKAVGAMKAKQSTDKPELDTPTRQHARNRWMKLRVPVRLAGAMSHSKRQLKDQDTEKIRTFFLQYIVEER